MVAKQQTNHAVPVMRRFIPRLIWACCGVGPWLDLFMRFGLCVCFPTCVAFSSCVSGVVGGGQGCSYTLGPSRRLNTRVSSALAWQRGEGGLGSELLLGGLAMSCCSCLCIFDRETIEPRYIWSHVLQIVTHCMF